MKLLSIRSSIRQTSASLSATRALSASGGIAPSEYRSTDPRSRSLAITDEGRFLVTIMRMNQRRAGSLCSVYRIKSFRMTVPSLETATTTTVGYDRQCMEDVGFLTCMTLVLLGNYAQTGHFGGPLAYTPYNVAIHLAGPELGGLRYDYRKPKHPFCDKFMLAGGHKIPTSYALWMILGQALYRKDHATGDPRYHVAPDVAMLPVDALGFRRGAGALRTLLADQGLSDHPLFAQAKGRGIRALSGHIESTDLPNDVNGGPSGVGVATAAGKAAFWDIVGAPMGSPKVFAFEGEFALCAGHAQELKTQALALQVGMRLRIFFS